MLAKIISSGQAGTERAALDAAVDSYVPTGGWASPRPDGGELLRKFHLAPLPPDAANSCAERNVIGSDGTLNVLGGTPGGPGAADVGRLCRRYVKPLLEIDPGAGDATGAAGAVAEFIRTQGIRVLNVTGHPGEEGYGFTYSALRQMITTLSSPGAAEPRLYVSFDLVGSTAFKAGFDYWTSTLFTFFHKLERLFADAAETPGGGGFRPWKYLGDEAVFVAPTGPGNLWPKVRAALHIASEIDVVMRAYLSGLTDLATGGGGRPSDPAWGRGPDDTLGVKATAWLALVRPYYGGITRCHPHEFNLPQFGEVVGPRMDEGFRLSQEASPGCVTLAAELAHLLCLGDATGEARRSLVHRHDTTLKGVWRGAPYPVVSCLPRPFSGPPADRRHPGGAPPPPGAPPVEPDALWARITAGADDAGCSLLERFSASVPDAPQPGDPAPTTAPAPPAAGSVTGPACPGGGRTGGRFPPAEGAVRPAPVRREDVLAAPRTGVR